MKNYVYMTDKDNVVTMIRQLNAGEAIEVDGVKIKANQDIPVYHKIAIEEIKTGETVVKYGESIGTATFLDDNSFNRLFTFADLICYYFRLYSFTAKTDNKYSTYIRIFAKANQGIYSLKIICAYLTAAMLMRNCNCSRH